MSQSLFVDAELAQDAAQRAALELASGHDGAVVTEADHGVLSDAVSRP